MRKTLIRALAIGGFAATAHAADVDLSNIKIPDGISWAGVTVYGTIDVGVAYQNHGAPISGAYPDALEYNIFGSPNTSKRVLSLAENGLAQSTVGIKVEKTLFADWAAVGKADTGFNPLSGELADACASLARMNGIITPLQISRGDSSRCGQFFNGVAYAGVSNPTYGTLTVGRQQSLELDNMAVYDPQLLSYAFSLIGYSGAFAGAGFTETARWDNSVKYVFQYGPVHAAGMYTNGGWDTAIFSGAYGGNVGFTWRGLSVDAVYQHENGAVSASPLAFATTGANGNL